MQDTSRHWGTLPDVNKSIAGKLVYGSLNIPLFLSLFEVLMTYTHSEHHISLQSAVFLSVKVTSPIYFHQRNVTYLAPRYNHRLKPRLWPVATHRRHATLVNKLLYLGHISYAISWLLCYYDVKRCIPFDLFVIESIDGPVSFGLVHFVWNSRADGGPMMIDSS